MGAVRVRARSSELIFGFCMVKAMKQMMQFFLRFVSGILALIEQSRLECENFDLF